MSRFTDAARGLDPVARPELVDRGGEAAGALTRAGGRGRPLFEGLLERGAARLADNGAAVLLRQPTARPARSERAADVSGVGDPAEWFVLLIGRSSGVGKTSVAAEVARRLGAAWLMVDDLRLALERSGLPIPDSTHVERIGAPDGLAAVGEAVAPGIEVVIENHVDQRIPVVIEGDGILPSLFERAPIRLRATGGRVRAVFLYEPDADALHANLVARGADDWRDDLRWYARRSAAHGDWLRREAERRGLATLRASPLNTLTDRVLAATALTVPHNPRAVD